MNFIEYIALGPAIGLVIGVVIGNYYEKKYEKAGMLRPLTKEERRIQKRNSWWVFGVGLVVLIGVLAGYFLSK